MRKNNRGFSLVELIVAFAIAAIAGLAAFQMMSFGNNSFRNTSTDVGLQYEQQIVVNQLRDYILESSNAIHYDESSKSLYVFKQTKNTTTTPSGETLDAPYQISRITFNDPNAGLSEGDEGYDSENVGEMYVNTKDFSNILDDYTTGLSDIGRKFGSDVKDVTYDLSKVSKGLVSFDITFLSGGKEYSSHQVVSLRNTIVDADDLKDIYETRIEVNSFIESVSIYRDGVRVNSDSIMRPSYENANELILEAHYTAKIEKNQYSEFDYPDGVTWELDSSYAGVTGAEVGDEYVIYVEGNVDGTVKLTATSVADPTVSKEIIVTIKSTGGVYPKSARIIPSATTVQNENGSRTYTLLPRIEYTGMIGSSTYLEGVDALDKIEWCVDEATRKDLMDVSEGLIDNIDPLTGQISFSSKANGHSFTFYFKVKQRKADGTVLESEPYTLTVEGIPENYTTPFKVAINAVSLRDEFVYTAVNWEESCNENVYYYWKIIPAKDNKSDQWNNAEHGTRATDFNDIVRIFENPGQQTGMNINREPWYITYYPGAVKMTDNNKWNSKISVNGSIYSGITDWYSTGADENWYVSREANLGPLIYVQSYLNWTYQYQFKAVCFAVTEDGSKVYDANGEHDISNVNSFVVSPIEGTTTIKPVVLKLQQVANTTVSEATKHANYKTDLVLVPGTEERYFRFTAQGLNLTFMGVGTSHNYTDIRGGYSLKVDGKGRSFTPQYAFKSLAGQTLTMSSTDFKPTNYYYENNGVLGFKFTFNKDLTSVNGLKPEIMEYSILLEQDYELPNNKGKVYNKTESEKIKYSIDINYGQK